MTAKVFMIASALAFLTPAACATVMLDQDAKVNLIDGSTFQSSNSVWTGGDGRDSLETFTAGKTGTLTTIALQALEESGPATFYLSVYQGNGAELGSNAAGTVAFANIQSESSYNAGGMVNIDVSSLAFKVAAGSLYSYSITAQHGADASCCDGGLVLPIGINLSDGTFIINNYAGGRDYRRTWTDGTTPGWDLSLNFAVVRGFQTYVDVSPVPESPQGEMFIFGLGVIATLNRVRVRSQKP
ncbi:hypothetical protein [Rugamonas sp.]|uniref:hypothetical protein n=1 Tax=Rugamonas sp. TaxID=1926287 RepID=UPI0025E11548|nr:hypothetical protein [Rugamonas sp.]